MLKKHSKFFESLLLLMDWVTLSVSWILSYYLRFYSGTIPVYKGIPPFKIYLTLLIFMIPLWSVVFKTFGMYRPRRVSTRFSEIIDIGRASTFATLALISLTFIFRQYEFSRLTFFYFWLINIVFLSLTRILFRAFLSFIRKKGYNRRFALVVGTEKLGQELVHKLRSHLDLGVQIKRSLDIVFSSFILILLSPFMLIIALLIKLTSAGPVFYKQERMGLDGKIFNMIKFRTMLVNAEGETGPVWASKDDPRCTNIGKFLRMTSMDELPQFFNVLKGNMSIVGPRPERPVLIENFRDKIPKYMLRHKMKAGITGWAQVNGWRGSTSLEKRIEYDLYYIENWSLYLDLKIIWLTIWNGLVNKNAY